MTQNQSEVNKENCSNWEDSNSLLYKFRSALTTACRLDFQGNPITNVNRNAVWDLYKQKDDERYTRYQELGLTELFSYIFNRDYYDTYPNWDLLGFNPAIPGGEILSISNLKKTCCNPNWIPTYILDYDDMCANGLKVKVTTGKRGRIIYTDYNGIRHSDVISNDTLSYITFQARYLSKIKISSIDTLEIDSNYINIDKLFINSKELTKVTMSNNPTLKNVKVAKKTSLVSLIASNAKFKLDNILNNSPEMLTLTVSKAEELLGKPINFSLMPKIRTLTLSQMLWNTVDLTYLTDLRTLTISYNNLSELDIRNNTLLSSMNACSNPIKNIDLSNNVNLKALNLYYMTLLETLDLTPLTLLTSFSGFQNAKLRGKLDFSNAPLLTSIQCYDNPLLDEINVRGCTKLTTLKCHYTNIHSLDLSDNVNLTMIYIPAYFYDHKEDLLLPDNKTQYIRFYSKEDYISSDGKTFSAKKPYDWNGNLILEL